MAKSIREVKKNMDKEVSAIQKTLHDLVKKYGQEIDCANLEKEDDSLYYLCAKQCFAVVNAALAALETY